ncbi:MAG: zinc metalloprotease HtpX [Fusobacterium sp.]|nr:zinc metalloprotease HtpX [Fusobacterium sp.]MDO5789105.1 zinc metalloprotease HtpX [Fusobacterium sp.]
MENDIIRQLSLKPNFIKGNNIMKTILWLLFGNLVVIGGLHILTQGAITLIIHYILALGFIGPTFSLFISRYSIKKTFGVILIDENDDLTPKQKFYYKVVSTLSSNVGLKKIPEVGIYESNEVNAFATGYNRNNALIAVSTQLLESMDEEEITGVVGHEMAHIINGDMVTMTILRGLVNTLVYIICAPFLFYHWLNKNSNKSTWYDIIITFWIYRIVKKIASFFGDLVAKGFSRHREFKADSLSGLLTDKKYMEKALKKLKIQSFQKEDEFQASYSMLKINASPSIMDIFSSHPSIERRLVRLEKNRENNTFSNLNNKVENFFKECKENINIQQKEKGENKEMENKNINFNSNETMSEKDELLKIYLDVSSEKSFFKYKKAFDLYEEKGKITWSWSWAACLLGSYYLIYRKSYLIGILMGIISNLLAILLLQVVGELSFIIVLILRGGFYNYFNYLRYKKCLEKATINGIVDKDILRKLGGRIFS